MTGGDGNDRLVWQGQAAESIDGGAGIDALKLTGGNLDLTVVPNRQITNVEQINMNAAGANTLTLTKADVLALSSTTDTLKVFGNSGDTVDLPSTFSDQGIAGSFHEYKNGAAIVLVDTDIAVV
jgi:hypothetical protein